MVVQLRICRIKTRETLIAEFADIADAETWLAARPEFVDVLGTVGGLSEQDDERLRVAMRPLDDAERAAIKDQEQAILRDAQEAVEREQREAAAALAERRKAQANADPNRPMHVGWARGESCRMYDETDPREVTDAARDAVLAWVRERDTWVHPRDQYVATAELLVWPGEIPDGEGDERVHPGGLFTVLAGDPPPLE